MEEDEIPETRTRRRWVVYSALGVLVLAPLALAVIWSQRSPIARSFIDAELKKRGVPATYDIAAVGTKLQRIEHLVIGDPKTPDLTADWAEIDTGISLSGVVVKSVRASGVRLRGKLVGNTLKLGALDKLMPPPSGKPFTFPDMDFALSDARMRLDTDYGALGARLDGAGNLSSKFNGKMAIVAPHIQHLACQGSGVNAYIDLAVQNRELRVNGPVRADKMGCGANRAETVALMFDAVVPERFDRWTGTGDLKAARVSVPGSRLGYVALSADFGGDRQSTAGKMNLGFRTATFSGGQAGATLVKGNYQFGLGDVGGPVFAVDGTIEATQLRPDRAALARITQYGSAGAGTVAAPIVSSLSDAVSRLGAGASGTARFSAAHKRGDGQIRLNAISAQSVSGAKLVFSGTDPVRYLWRKGGLLVSGLAVSGLARLTGGGFPDSDVQLAGGDGRWSGTARIAPLVSGETRIALSPVTFSAGRAGTRLETLATIDGRIGTTRIAGLQLPVSLRPGVSVFAGCRPLAFNALEIAGMTLSPSRIETCFDGNTARFANLRIAGAYRGSPFTLTGNNARYDLNTKAAMISAPRITGRYGGASFDLRGNAVQYAGGAVRVDTLVGGGSLGSSPFALKMNNIRYLTNNANISSEDVSFKLGLASSQTVLDVDQVSGVVGAPKASGRFAGARGKIGNIPLDMSNGSGNWRYAGGALALDGRVGVADRQATPRFQPLVSNNFTLRYAGDQVTASGMLTEPLTNTSVSSVDIVHRVSSGTGRAVLSVPGIEFNKQLQPEQLTRTTLGVIANVEGKIDGRGEIRWTPTGVSSDGRFSTKGLNFAAAFGPVRQMKGDIVFSDLLGLETPAGQTVQIAEINSGVQVLDGVVRYRLLPGFRTEVEGGRWPFSGGELILEPTVLDLSEAAQRHLTFRVVGLDAAKFVNALQFENIAATGIFDGSIPMVFDKQGGRIESGNLVVRQGGGTLSYVGEISQENLGTYGSIAFDALKSIRYNNLAIDLGGPIDGEMVTQIRFNGVNQSPIVPGRAKLPLPIKVVGLTGIPFIFNITIKAPFRGLVAMGRSFQDPSGIIADQLERERDRQRIEQEKTKTEADQPVQR